ncbi:MAG: hemerythrin domain-containing protein, partial [Chitinivibrionales bacterium]|nr:hemerythrin domain-containing protein [Chitinivibrionales bacterium]
MTELLDRNIKDILKEHPACKAELDRFKIGCTTCAVGTCRLKDIVEIHALSQEDEKKLFTAIAAVVFPGKQVTIPKLPRKEAQSSGRKKLCPPLQQLVEEHVFIKKVIGAIPRLIASLQTKNGNPREQIRVALDFIRNYADKYHHAKEEDILFGFFDPSQEIIAAMRNEHETGRGHVKATAAALDKADAAAIAEHLTAYATLLSDHIRKEDEVLYP